MFRGQHLWWKRYDTVRLLSGSYVHDEYPPSPPPPRRTNERRKREKEGAFFPRPFRRKKARNCFETFRENIHTRGKARGVPVRFYVRINKPNGRVKWTALIYFVSAGGTLSRAPPSPPTHRYHCRRFHDLYGKKRKKTGRSKKTTPCFSHHANPEPSGKAPRRETFAAGTHVKG